MTPAIALERLRATDEKQKVFYRLIDAKQYGDLQTKGQAVEAIERMSVDADRHGGEKAKIVAARMRWNRWNADALDLVAEATDLTCPECAALAENIRYITKQMHEIEGEGRLFR